MMFNSYQYWYRLLDPKIRQHNGLQVTLNNTIMVVARKLGVEPDKLQFAHGWMDPSILPVKDRPPDCYGEFVMVEVEGEFVACIARRYLGMVDKECTHD